MENHAEGDIRVGRIGYPPNQAATAIRDRFQQWRGQYLATCARLDEALPTIDRAIRDRISRGKSRTAQWWGRYRAWDARFHEQQHQPARYSLIAVPHATAFAKWLLGLSGAGMVVAFGFYVQSYLSILSIKNDCVSLHFVAAAISDAARLAGLFLLSGILALFALIWPTVVGIGRNLLRWYKAHELPPLQPEHKFDEWSDFQVTGRVTIVQGVLVGFSFLLFVLLTFGLVFFSVGSTPEGVLRIWHKFELQCLLPQ